MHYYLDCQKENGSKRIENNALVALTLMIAESKPPEKETLIKIIVNLINRKNTELLHFNIQKRNKVYNLFYIFVSQ